MPTIIHLVACSWQLPLNLYPYNHRGKKETLESYEELLLHDKIEVETGGKTIARYVVSVVVWGQQHQYSINAHLINTWRVVRMYKDLEPEVFAACHHEGIGFLEEHGYDDDDDDDDDDDYDYVDDDDYDYDYVDDDVDYEYQWADCCKWNDNLRDLCDENSINVRNVLVDTAVAAASCRPPSPPPLPTAAAAAQDTLKFFNLNDIMFIFNVIMSIFNIMLMMYFYSR